MATYRKYHWLELFEAFEQSGLAQTEFCKQRKINPKYFNVKFNQHRQAANELAGFTRLQVASSRQPTSSASQVVIEHGQCKVHCPTAMSLSAIVDLVRALA